MEENVDCVIRNDERGPVLYKSHPLSQTVSQLRTDELGYFSEEISKHSIKCLLFKMTIVKYKIEKKSDR